MEHLKQSKNLYYKILYSMQKIEDDSKIEMIYILLILSIEVDYCLRDCAYVFVLDYLDYRNAA